MQRPEDAPLLEVSDLHAYIRGRHGPIRAVNGISYKVRRHERVAIVGESGCGKSVSALSLVSLLPSSIAWIPQGKVLLDGVDLLQMSERKLQRVRGKRIGMIFQDPMTALNPLLTIERQITESMEVHLGWSRRHARRAALELLERVQIPRPGKVMEQHPHELSGGMQQRVALAMALGCQPDLLIADEPTTALDVTVQAEVMYLLNELAEEQGTAVIFISHDLNLVAEFADQIMVMYAGRIVESGPTHEVYSNPRHPYTQDLLRAIPRLSDPVGEPLAVIGGRPPDPSQLPSGCSYHPRCRRAVEKCVRCDPLIEPIPSPSHHTACWVVWEEEKEGPPSPAPRSAGGCGGQIDSAHRNHTKA